MSAIYKREAQHFLSYVQLNSAIGDVSSLGDVKGILRNLGSAPGGGSRFHLSSSLSLNLSEHEAELPLVFLKSPSRSLSSVSAGLSNLSHFLQLKRCNGGIRDNDEQTKYLNVEQQFVIYRLACGIGFILMLLGVRNLQFGAKNAGDLLALVTGLGSFSYGLYQALGRVPSAT